MVLEVKIMVTFEKKGVEQLGGERNLWGAAYVVFLAWI